MVEVADVDPVREYAVVPDLDVHVAVDRVLRTEDDLVADAQIAFVTPNRVALADEHPPAEGEPPVALARVQLDLRPEEDEPFRLDVRMQDLEPEETERTQPVS